MWETVSSTKSRYFADLFWSNLSVKQYHVKNKKTRTSQLGLFQGSFVMIRLIEKCMQNGKRVK